MTPHPNPYAEIARERKARAIALALIAAGTTDPDVVAVLRPDVRRVAANVANVNPPSQATWDKVVEIVREHRRHAAEAWALDQEADPFAGL